eukprot:scaffold125361_cov14-Tisochrysis_lutea.AAC.1
MSIFFASAGEARSTRVTSNRGAVSQNERKQTHVNPVDAHGVRAPRSPRAHFTQQIGIWWSYAWFEQKEDLLKISCGHGSRLQLSYMYEVNKDFRPGPCIQKLVLNNKCCPCLSTGRTNPYVHR